VRDDIGVVLVPVVTISGCDVHSIRIECDGSSPPVVLTVIYRHLSADVTEFNYFEKFITTSHASNHIIASDINIDTLDHSKMMSILVSCLPTVSPILLQFAVESHKERLCFQ